MSDGLTTPDKVAVIKVCGIGGGGGNAVNRMVEAKLGGVEFIAINTDLQDLRRSKAGMRLQIGSGITAGLGAGAQPEVGRRAADEDRDEIEKALRGADMVFLTAGLGGGTGSGAAPVVAEISSSTQALTVAIVTVPFSFEGVDRWSNAMAALEALKHHVDALIVVPNDRLAELTRDLAFLSAFQQADEVLHNGVRAISEIISVPGLVNVDFEDVKTIMRQGGRSLMGIGTAQGPDRATIAAREAIVCPLLEQSTIEGARGVIVNIRGGRDIGMREILDAVSTVRETADPKANIIFGAVVEDDELEELQVTVIASRFPESASDVVPKTTEADVANWRAPAAEPRSPVAVPPAGQPAVAKKSEERKPAARAQAKVEPVRIPEVQDLFPMDDAAPTASKKVEELDEPEDAKEDLSLPVWMREMIQKRKERQK
ncbi:MAG TPA: cell division protein FtsZ [Candidatus Hydrogenedentes bacterium]|nr:cell division protein FtsZ [Candidatus Hydrogenedentota bacterium]HPG68444.1 cell division protein FtsZ [Candidatus Hydrogenedentota bacterium]